MNDMTTDDLVNGVREPNRRLYWQERMESLGHRAAESGVRQRREGRMGGQETRRTGVLQ